MTAYYAHSPRDGKPGQEYAEHVLEVCERALQYIWSMSPYCMRGLPTPSLEAVVRFAAEFHDIGKLQSENQRVLSGEKKARTLPKNHVDAGVASLLRKYYDEGNELAWFAAIMVYSHHAGLPDFTIQRSRGKKGAWRDAKVSAETDALLPELERLHRRLIAPPDPVTCGLPQLNGQVLSRLLLSCLVDADHTDTAMHYGNYPTHEDAPLLRPQERLEQLNRHEGRKDREGERNRLRREHFSACRDCVVDGHFSACGSPCGSGKTLSDMAHALAQAERRSLRRIFVVLPFTNIITQSVDEYRKALVLPGEDPASVVAELHHCADFEDPATRHLTALWRAPIIVTTAVAFFETMASRSPAALRRLHALPGSAIFMDEAHAALPAHLLPLAWKWMNIFAREWGCYWILASGSLTRFWEIPEIAQETANVEVPEIVSESLRRSLAHYEEGRVSYRYEPNPKNAEELATWISRHPGPRLVILNTVRSAAVVARTMANRFGKGRVEHLSTALTPEDREKTLECVKARLADKTDNDWTLVATSCVEAGMDFSFRTGFRELCSLVSLLQAAGRINREGIYPDAQIWVFHLAADPLLKGNPGIEKAAAVLKTFLDEKAKISPELSTQSIKDEIRLKGMEEVFKKLLEQEFAGDFPAIENGFKVIEQDSRLAVVDKEIVEKVRQRQIDWRELQRKSVRITGDKLKKMDIPEILPGIYEWNLGYHGFLGYMTGILR